MNERRRHRNYEMFPPIEDAATQTIKIPLVNRRRQIVMYATADLCMAPKLLQFSYCAKKRRTIRTEPTYYAVSSIGITMHELVIGEKAPYGFLIDHIHGDSIDNRRLELRFATPAQNNQNRNKMIGTSSRFYGVSYSPKHGKWIARISLLGKPHCLGCFHNEENAATVYDAHAILFYGKYARTNGLLDPITEARIVEKGIPSEWMIQFGRKVVKLPKNVERDNDGRYFLTSERGPGTQKEAFETLAECLAARDEISEERKQSLVITRNAAGQAVVRANHHGGIVECIVDDDIWRDIQHMSFSYGYPYMQIKKKGCGENLHTFLYRMYIEKVPLNHTVDHKNVNYLDCRLDNLRAATKALQKHNQFKSDKSIGKYKGVNYMKGKFHTFVDHRSHATYDTEEEAADHANRIFLQNYGSDARLNEIDFSQRTTKDNRIPDELITIDFVMGLEHIKDLRYIATKKKLLKSMGGPLRTIDMKGENFEWLKMQIASRLFNVTFTGLSDEPPVKGINSPKKK